MFPKNQLLVDPEFVFVEFSFTLLGDEVMKSNTDTSVRLPSWPTVISNGELVINRAEGKFFIFTSNTPC